MSKIITGDEPAHEFGFTTADGSSHVLENGLTIRQYYAGLAMQGMWANNSTIEAMQIGSKNITESGKSLSEIIAMLSVESADALINELNKQP